MNTTNMQRAEECGNLVYTITEQDSGKNNNPSLSYVKAIPELDQEIKQWKLSINNLKLVQSRGRICGICGIRICGNCSLAVLAVNRKRTALHPPIYEHFRISWIPDLRIVSVLSLSKSPSTVLLRTLTIESSLQCVRDFARLHQLTGLWFAGI